MAKSKPSAPVGADWTQLLADPDLLSHLGELLQTYRDAAPEEREQRLVEVLRRIKGAKAAKGVAKAAGAGASQSASASSADAASLDSASAIEAISGTAVPAPPFEPDIFTPSWGQDRRRYPRIKCFVAVELRPEGSDTPIWGNLSNTSLGGCLVETPTPVPTGVQLKVGLWLANGKIWVKGLVLNGVATRSNPAVRIKFGELEPEERENLRQFLRFVESTTRGYFTEHGYLAQLKR